MSAAPTHIPAGTVLFRAGDPCNGFVVVHEGAIRVTLTAANGREVVLYRVHPGDVCLQTFSCLIDGRNYSAQGIAETDLVADIIPAARFQQTVAQDEDFRTRIFQAVARRFSDFEHLVEDVALTGFDVRLARTLLKLADIEGHIVATHEQLAMETASGRAVVSRQLGQFARSGWVTVTRGRVTLLNTDALKRLATSAD